MTVFCFFPERFFFLILNDLTAGNKFIRHGHHSWIVFTRIIQSLAHLDPIIVQMVELVNAINGIAAGVFTSNQNKGVSKLSRLRLVNVGAHRSVPPLEVVEVEDLRVPVLRDHNLEAIVGIVDQPPQLGSS